MRHERRANAGGVVSYMEREELTGPDYHPTDPRVRKWASQPGSVFIGGHKVKVERPRLRGLEGERRLKTYAMLQDPSQFSEELLTKTLRGLSGRKYRETVLETAGCFGISPSSVSVAWCRPRPGRSGSSWKGTCLTTSLCGQTTRQTAKNQVKQPVKHGKEQENTL